MIARHAHILQACAFIPPTPTLWPAGVLGGFAI